ncbi:hypothetical protein [Bradyrhizobium sp. WSM1417]|uniref:hypothetical protein n=1 Tax=Bradyrhizobium sp. WSM1417 TaxID=754500 RepID=UPI0004806A47|nr:hypothetical protein [Bradyrhizobium sp. WSM1417]
MTDRLPIDALRNSAKSGLVGSDGDDSAITDMIPIGNTLYMVKERGIYGVQLADQIDPQRTNASIPDTQQKILAIGSSDPIVSRTLLTAHTLFDEKMLPASFEQEKGLCLALELLKDFVAIETIRLDLETVELQARAAYEAQRPVSGMLALPSIGNLDARCDAFAQKAGHIVNTLEAIARLFYASEIRSKWIDSLTALVGKCYGNDSSFARYMREAGPFLLFVLGMRNMIEHPTEEKHIKTFDFKMTPSALIDPPYVEIVRPGEEKQKATITPLMKKMVDDLLSVSEVLIAHLCAVHVQQFAGMPIDVVELPIEQRSNKTQRFYYGCQFGDQIVRIG